VDAGYLSSARDSETDRPRSSESAPKRIDPLTRRRPSNADAAAAALAASEEPDHRASALAALSSGPELWRCLKCGAQNEAEEGVDYCNHCSTRRGYSGARGVGAQVIKYG
jgi:rubrerythrin